MKTISWEEGEKRLLSNAEVLKECQKWWDRYPGY